MLIDVVSCNLNFQEPHFLDLVHISQSLGTLHYGSVQLCQPLSLPAQQISAPQPLNLSLGGGLSAANKLFIWTSASPLVFNP